MKLFTIGFTKKNAKTFFELLGESEATAIVDTRVNNVSQLAGFTKRDDLEFFAGKLCGMSYRHELRLAPTNEMLRAYKAGDLTWQAYEETYVRLLRARGVELLLDPADLDRAVLLCSEATPERCHRRLAAEYLAQSWTDVEILHL